ncbi:MAG: hypothetical protein ACFCU1_06900 [Sumerlaeia bacterium]
MAVQPAKSTFSKAEIAEILRENVELFKDEPGFPEYIVNLGLYLMDHAYVIAGERAHELDSIVNALAALSPKKTLQPKNANPLESIKEQFRRESGNQLASLLKQDNQSRAESQFDDGLMSLDDSEAYEETDPHFLIPQRSAIPQQNEQNKGRLSNFKPVMTSTKDFGDIPKEIISPTPEEGFQEPKTDKLNELQIEEIRRQTQADIEDLRREPKSKTNQDQGSSSGRQPAAPKQASANQQVFGSEVEEEEKKKTLGRAHVYKVARDYRAKREDGEQCPSCGARTRGRNVCPSCGHIL